MSNKLVCSQELINIREGEKPFDFQLLYYFTKTLYRMLAS